MSTLTGASPEGLITLARMLINSWYDKRHRTDVVTRSAERSAARYPMVHASATHAHRSAEALPLVRASYECAITATWFSRLPDTIQTVGEEDLRQRRAVQRDVEAAGLDLDLIGDGGCLLCRILRLRSHATVVCAHQHVEAPEAPHETPVVSGDSRRRGGGLRPSATSRLRCRRTPRGWVRRGHR